MATLGGLQNESSPARGEGQAASGEGLLPTSPAQLARLARAAVRFLCLGPAVERLE